MLQRGGWTKARTMLGAAIVAAALAALPAPASAALLDTVTAGTYTFPGTTATANIAMPATLDITRAFVVCATRSNNSNNSVGLASCQLSGAVGSAQLTIQAGATPANGGLVVQYHVAQFTAGVSVQRGSATFSGTAFNPTGGSTPALTGVDCAKTFLIGSVRSSIAASTTDERSTIQGVIACPTATTTTLTLSRLEGVAGSTVVYEWQVITFEGASVQRNTLCIGSWGTCGGVPGGYTQGRNDSATLATPVDTTKSIVLFTTQAAASINGIEGEWRVRGDFTTGGAAVNTIRFDRALTTTTSGHHVDISWEVVTFSDGTLVQGTEGIGLAVTVNPMTISFPTVDVTRAVPLFSASGGEAGVSTRLDDTSTTIAVNGSDGGTQSEVDIRRISTGISPTLSAAVVTFFRCTTASGLAYDRLCTVGASTTSNQATVSWTTPNTVVIARSTSPIAGNLTNGVNYCTNAGAGCTTTVGGVPIVYPAVVTPPTTDASFTQGGLTTSPATTYYYKVWAKNPTATGSCTAAPCYVTGTEVDVTPRLGATTWSSIVSGGAALNPGVPTNAGGVSLGSNAGKLITLDVGDGAWTSAPVSTSGVNQGYLTVADTAGGEAVIGADSSGFVYSLDPATGAVNWLVKLNADAIRAAPTLYARAWFSAAMAAAYPGAYDLLFFATANTSTTSNTIIALRSDTGAVVWTYAPTMDVVLGQPALDYTRDRLYWASRNGSAGNQQSLWILDVATNPATLVVAFSGTNADFTTAPTQSFDGASLFIGDEAGKLHVVDLTQSPPTRSTTYAGGSAFRGFVWEDFTYWGVLYFVTANGYVNALATPTDTALMWSVRPAATGTVSHLLPGEFSLWTGGSDGVLYQLSLADGTIEKTFTVGDGTRTVGPVSGFSLDDLYTTTSDGRIYRILLTNQSLP